MDLSGHLRELNQITNLRFIIDQSSICQHGPHLLHHWHRFHRQRLIGISILPLSINEPTLPPLANLALDCVIVDEVIKHTASLLDRCLFHLFIDYSLFCLELANDQADQT